MTDLPFPHNHPFGSGPEVCGVVTDVDSLFRTIFEQAAVGITVQDLEGKIIFANAASAHLLGLSASDLVGCTYQSLVYPLDCDLDQDQRQALLRGERVNYVVEKRFFHPNQHLVWGRLSVSLIRDSETKPVYWLTVHENITAQKQAQAELRTSRLHFLHILEAMPLGFYSLDREGRLTYVNYRCEQVLERSRTEILGKQLWEVVPDLQQTQFARDHERVLHEGTVTVCEGFWAARQAWFEVHLFPTPQGMAAYFLDITSRKQTEQHLQQLNAELDYQVQVRNDKLRRAIEMEELLCVITDEVRSSLDQEEILQAAVNELSLGLNLSICQICVPNIDNVTYRVRLQQPSSLPFTPDQQALSLNPQILSQLQEGKPVFAQGDDSALPRFNTLYCPIHDNERLLAYLYLVRHPQQTFDSLEIRLVEQVASQCAIGMRQAQLYELARHQVQQLEELHHLKDNFLRLVSHELRAPLTNIRIALSMLRRLADGEQRERYLDILQQECEREIRLVNDLLELQSLEAGVKQLHPVPLDLCTWVPPLVEGFQLRAQARELHLHLRLHPEIPQITTDPHLLERVLVELLNNACKYTPPDHNIILSLLPTTLTGQRGVRIEVINTGIEIPADILPRLFEKFFRVPHTDPYQQGGSGLGLALLRQAVEYLQGSIHVSSQDNQTRFQVDLPLSISPSCRLITD
ncbi:MAG: PAS domain S-box protein [Synechococcaceae cyanobacterium SM2_3_1]|nr:PAS domain S-box protein [Synechococcaceae cyanobacterium SM2_3_1]